MKTNLITIKKAPRLAIAAIKSFKGMEGYGLNANLYLDGHKVCEVIDDGNGGGPRFRWLTNGPTCMIEVNNYLASLNLPPDNEMEQDLDWLIGVTVDEHKNEQRKARLAKTNILYRLPDQPQSEFYAVAHKGKPEAYKTAILKKYPAATFLS